MLQPSLSLQIEFHTSNLFQMLLSVAACQFCLPLTQCLCKVFSPRSSGQNAVFSDSIAPVGTRLQSAPVEEVLNKSKMSPLFLCVELSFLLFLFLSRFQVCDNLIWRFLDDSLHLWITVCTPLSFYLFQSLWCLGESYYYVAFPFCSQG